MDDGCGQRRERWRLGAVVVTALVVVISVYPMTWPAGRDSFPLSSYPMFAGLRDDATVRLVVVLGDDGEFERPLPTEATGHRHLTQAVRALSQAVAAGGEQPQRMCEHAARWAKDAMPTVTRVRIVTAVYDGLAYLRDGVRDPVELAEHAECSVGS